MSNSLEIGRTSVLLQVLGHHPVLTLDKFVHPNSPQTTGVYAPNNDETGVGLEHFVLELLPHGRN